jgi:hypothetical protein
MGTKWPKSFSTIKSSKDYNFWKTYEPKVKWKNNELLSDESCKLGFLRFPFKSSRENNHFDLTFVWFIGREKVMSLPKLGHGHEFYEFVLPCGSSTQHFVPNYINLLLFVVWTIWHTYNFNLRGCLGLISKLNNLLYFWKLGNVFWVCILLQNWKMVWPVPLDKPWGLFVIIIWQYKWKFIVN